VGYGNKFYTHSIQMEKYCAKIPWDYWPAMEATTPCETRKSHDRQNFK